MAAAPRALTGLDARAAQLLAEALKSVAVTQMMELGDVKGAHANLQKAAALCPMCRGEILMVVQVFH